MKKKLISYDIFKLILSLLPTLDYNCRVTISSNLIFYLKLFSFLLQPIHLVQFLFNNIDDCKHESLIWFYKWSKTNINNLSYLKGFSLLNWKQMEPKQINV